MSSWHGGGSTTPEEHWRRSHLKLGWAPLGGSFRPLPANSRGRRAGPQPLRMEEEAGGEGEGSQLIKDGGGAECFWRAPPPQQNDQPWPGVEPTRPHGAITPMWRTTALRAPGVRVVVVCHKALLSFFKLNAPDHSCYFCSGMQKRIANENHKKKNLKNVEDHTSEDVGSLTGNFTSEGKKSNSNRSMQQLCTSDTIKRKARTQSIIVTQLNKRVMV